MMVCAKTGDEPNADREAKHATTAIAMVFMDRSSGQAIRL
jgi:hypothetical protein